MRGTIALADDADLAHLVDLIDMLPGPGTRSFWGGLDEKIGDRLRPILAGQGNARDVDYLAVYILKYLGRGNGHITEDRITENLRGVGAVPAAGYAWVEDATRTAWTLVNRYSLPAWRGHRNTPGGAWLEN
ncbi:hypothetical protein ACFRCG_07085 [Embleya sp. NPDC056575]|uniref:hypothetical protein n=1 Tax=unclassified Embleya TaxID=2699296 RepID=UPI0036C87B29